MMSNFQPDDWRECAADAKYLVRADGAIRRNGGAILKPQIIQGTGYAQVRLSDRKKYSVHRLVAMAYLEPVSDKPIVNHKNGDRTDNRAVNLEWMTHSENLRHGFQVLGSTRSGKGRFSALHPTSKAVRATCVRTGATMEFDCALDAVRQIGATSSGISRACSGKIGSHKGYCWSFGSEREVNFNEPPQRG